MINIGGIGQINIGVGADISGLNSDFDAMVGAASSAGRRIADALGEGASQGKGLEDQINGAATALERLTMAANGAASQLANIGTTATTNVSGLTTSFDDLGTSITGLGYSLSTVGLELSAISAGLVELTTGVLEAAGHIEQTRIGFESFSDSVQAGDQKLEELYNLGKQSPFDVEKIVDVGRRLLAVGQSAESVTPLVKAMMDTVAATGAGQAGLDSLTRAFQRMDEEQNVTMRDLRQIAYQVPGALQIVADSLDTSIAGLFQSARNHMLDAAQVSTALLEGMQSKFGDFAQKQADTLLGQWQIIKNAFFDVSVTLGNALLPAFKALEQDLLGVAENVKEAATWFGSLSEGTRSFAVAVGLALASTGPLVLALGALILGVGKTIEAFQTIAAIAPALGEMFGTITIMGGATLPVLGSLAAAVAAVAAAFVVLKLDGTIDALANLKNEVQLAIDPVTSLGSAFRSLLGDLNLTTEFTTITAIIDAIVAKFGGLSGILKSLGVQFLDEIAPSFAVLRDGSTLAAGGIEFFTGKSQGMQTAMQGLLQSLLPIAPTLTALSGVVATLPAGAQAVVNSQLALEAAYASAKKNYNDLLTAYQSGTVTMSELQRGQVLMDQAMKAATPTIKDQKESFAALEKELQQAGVRFENLNTIFKAATTAFNENKISAGLFLETYEKLQTAAAKIGQAFINVQAEVLKIGQAFQNDQAKYEAAKLVFEEISDRFKQGEATGAQFEEALKKVTDAAKKAGDTFHDTTAEIKAFTDQAREQQLSFEADVEALAALQRESQPTIQSQLAIADAFKKVSSEASSMGVTITKIGDGYKLAADTSNPAIATIVNSLSALILKQGLTVETIKNGIPTLIDGKTGMIEYGKSLENNKDQLSQLITLWDGSTVRVQQFTTASQNSTSTLQGLRGAASSTAASFIDLANAHAQVTQNSLSMKSALMDIEHSMFNVTTAIQQLGIGVQQSNITFDEQLQVFNRLNSVHATTIQQQLVLDQAFKNLQASAQALGIQINFVGGQLQFVSDAATSGNPIIQQYIDALKKLQSAAESAGNAVDGMSKSLEDVPTFGGGGGGANMSLSSWALDVASAKNSPLAAVSGGILSSDLDHLINISSPYPAPTLGGPSVPVYGQQAAKEVSHAVTTTTTALSGLTTTTTGLTTAQISQLTGTQKAIALLNQFGAQLQDTGSTVATALGSLVPGATGSGGDGSTTTVSSSPSGNSFVDSVVNKLGSLVPFFTNAFSDQGFSNPAQSGLQAALGEAYNELGVIVGGGGDQAATLPDILNAFNDTLKQFVASTHELGSNISASGSTAQDAANNLGILLGDLNPNFNLTTGFGNQFLTDPSRLLGPATVQPGASSTGSVFGPQFDAQTGKWVDSADALGSHLSIAANSFQEASDKLAQLVGDLNPNFGNGGISGANRFLTDPSTLLNGPTVQPGPISVNGPNSGHPGSLGAPSLSLQDMVNNLSKGLTATGGPGTTSVPSVPPGGDTYIVQVTGNTITSQSQVNGMVDQVVNKLRQTAGQLR